MTILFEDSHLLIVNKPAGLTVNRSSTTKDTETLFDWVERYASWPLVTSALEFNDRCGVVHRLDKETSGALVIAKDPDTFVALQKQFKDRTVQKEYTVLVHGQLDNLSRPGFIVDAPIGRNPRNRFRQAVVESGRPAVTEFELRRAAPWGGSTDETVTPPTRPIAVSLLSAYPKTGRMHQIRVHLAALNHPVCGDPVYSPKNLYKEYTQLLEKNHIDLRMFLHAAKITFTHPVTGKQMTVEAPLPPELAQVLQIYSPTNLDVTP